MPAWNSSSLVASEGLTRHSKSGLLKNTSERLSKQHLTANKMFRNRRGQHGKDFQIGKKFRKKGKDVGMKGSFGGDMKSSSISPSIEEFDNMLHSSVTNNQNKKKSMFKRKQFG